MKRLILSLFFVFGVITFGSGSVLACCGPGWDAPEIELIAFDPDKLWPPNHKMVPIDLTVEGIGFEPLEWCVTDVAVQNIGPGEGSPKNDPDFFFQDYVAECDGCGWVYINGDKEPCGQVLELRAERSGKAGARIYTVQVTVVNSMGYQTIDYFNVMVPHDMSE